MKQTAKVNSVRVLPKLIPNVMHIGQVPGLWESIEELVQRSVDNTPAGMLTVEVVKRMLFEGDATALYTSRDGEVELLLVVMVVNYSSYKAARVIACAGRDMAEASLFMDVLSCWALTMGCLEVEAWCQNPATVRFVHRAGFKTKTTVVSLDLRGKLQ